MTTSLGDTIQQTFAANTTALVNSTLSMNSESTPTLNNDQKKRWLLDQLQNHTYCRLARSATHGVGVIAIRDIPIGTHPFRSPFRRPYTIVDLTADEVAQLPESSRKLVYDFFLPNSAASIYSIIDPSVIDISFFLNDSKSLEQSNICCCECTDGCGYDDFIATRDIKAGEELLLNYGNAANYKDDDMRTLAQQIVVNK